MPQQFELTLKAENRDAVVVRGELSDAEHETLVLYLQQHERLVQSKPLKEGFPCNFRVKWEQGANLEVETALPDNDTLGILLHRLRPFILQNEPASFIVASAIIARRVQVPYIQHFLRGQRRMFDGRQFQQTMIIKLDNKIVKFERVLCDWLNSHEYHADPDKRQAVDALFKKMPEEFMRTILVSMLVDKVEAIRNLAGLTAVMLGKSDSLTFKAHWRKADST